MQVIVDLDRERPETGQRHELDPEADCPAGYWTGCSTNESKPLVEEGKGR